MVLLLYSSTILTPNSLPTTLEYYKVIILNLTLMQTYYELFFHQTSFKKKEKHPKYCKPLL
jgi:hypothetical protein